MILSQARRNNLYTLTGNKLWSWSHLIHLQSWPGLVLICHCSVESSALNAETFTLEKMFVLVYFLFSLYLSYEMQPLAFSVFYNLTFDDKNSASSKMKRSSICVMCVDWPGLYISTLAKCTHGVRHGDISLLSQLEQDVTLGHLRPSELSVF